MMITTEGASEKDEACATPGTAQATKIGGSTAGAVTIIKGLFRDAVKAVLGRGDDEPQPQARRRSGETEGEFRRLARNLARRFDVRQSFKARATITSRFLTIPAEACTIATAYLSGTLDMLNDLNNDDGSDFDGGFDAPSEHISPQP
jgi:hypothetical protein